MTTASKNKWLQPGFLIVTGLLAVVAVGLNTTISAMRLGFQKDPVPLAKDLATLPAQLGDWMQVSKDQPLEKDIEDALAAKQYIFRDYVNTKLVTKQELAEFDGKSATDRKRLASLLQLEHPDAVVNLAVTYYTGLVDTVAHIPDRCYIADGFEPSEYETVQWDVGPNHLGKLPTDDQRIGARFINFEDQTTAGRVTRRVAYFFFTNGHYESDPLGVRKTLQNLRNKHGFYSKVELMTIKGNRDTGDRAAAQKPMISFLTAALPEIEKCMPDWNTVEGTGVKAK